MNITARTSLLLPGLLVFVVMSDAAAQRIDIPLARLQAGSDTIRMRAFYEMVASASKDHGRRPGGGVGPRIELLSARARQQDDLARQLIALLERENEVIARRRPEMLSEGYRTLYHPDLFVTVAPLQDPRAVKALLPVIENGDVVTTGLAAAGEAAVPAVIMVLAGADGLEEVGSGADSQEDR